MLSGLFEKVFLENLSRIHSRATEKIEELKAMEVTGQAGGGAVVATVSGLGEVKSVRIDREKVRSEDMDLLEDLIVVALRDAMSKAQEVQKQAAQELLADLPLARILGLGR